MSYNKFTTREGVIYTARVCEPLGKNTKTFVVDLMSAEDGKPVAEDGLFLTFPDEPGVKSGDVIKLMRNGNEFSIVEDTNG